MRTAFFDLYTYYSRYSNFLGAIIEAEKRYPYGNKNYQSIRRKTSSIAIYW